MTHLLLLFVAGGLGTLARFGLNTLVGVHDFPYGTWLVNALGCLLFGIVLGLVDGVALSREHGAVIMVGFLGAFTTFSAFAAEAESLLLHDRYWPCLVYVVGQNLVGILFVTVGLRIIR